MMLSCVIREHNIAYDQFEGNQNLAFLYEQLKGNNNISKGMGVLSFLLPGQLHVLGKIGFLTYSSSLN
ncbi:hypothetical protein Syun_015047 [Stephania yunnanensis]|uniref:Uncharacterized protein n=1 Tax=Stephania yunnanensis TaxID=152371 RepID=A0AAP0JKL6_9MAGN